MNVLIANSFLFLVVIFVGCKNKTKNVMLNDHYVEVDSSDTYGSQELKLSNIDSLTIHLYGGLSSLHLDENSFPVEFKSVMVSNPVSASGTKFPSTIYYYERIIDSTLTESMVNIFNDAMLKDPMKRDDIDSQNIRGAVVLHHTTGKEVFYITSSGAFFIRNVGFYYDKLLNNCFSNGPVCLKTWEEQIFVE